MLHGGLDMNLKEYIASIEDFPKEGILFRDITPLMLNGDAYKYACDQMVDFAKRGEGNHHRWSRG